MGVILRGVGTPVESRRRSEVMVMPGGGVVG